MTESMKPRMTIDLDEIERQLRTSAGEAPPKKDPLAELARIVGQDDPFRKLLDEGQPAPAAPTARPVVQPASAADLRATLPPDDSDRSPGGYDMRWQGSTAAHLQARALGEPEEEPPAPSSSEDDGLADYAYEPEKPRSRKRLVLVVGALVVAAAGITGVMLGRGSGSRQSGEAPLVQADNAPLKVAPQNPGGVEVPNQNRQIFERGSQDAQTRVVDRQEQPIDVKQAARSLPPAPAEPAPAPAPSGPSPVPPSTPTGVNPVASATAPTARPSAMASTLGEPKRVRTVTVRPDGSFDSPSPAPPERPSEAAAAPSATASSSSASAGGGATPSVAPVRPSAVPSPRPRPDERPTATNPTPPSGTSPAAAPRAAAAETPSATPAPKPAQRVPPLPVPSAVPPDSATPAARPSPRVAALPAPAENTAGSGASGGFAVQLGTRPSEREARAAFEQFQSRYASEMGGHGMIVPPTELNGKTVYRVRLGPMSRPEAVSTCVKLKAAGAECFVAAN
jgi:hypothetical protein